MNIILASLYINVWFIRLFTCPKTNSLFLVCTSSALRSKFHLQHLLTMSSSSSRFFTCSFQLINSIYHTNICVIKVNHRWWEMMESACLPFSISPSVCRYILAAITKYLNVHTPLYSSSFIRKYRLRLRKIKCLMAHILGYVYLYFYCAHITSVSIHKIPYIRCISEK